MGAESIAKRFQAEVLATSAGVDFPSDVVRSADGGVRFDMRMTAVANTQQVYETASAYGIAIDTMPDGTHSCSVSGLVRLRYTGFQKASLVLLTLLIAACSVVLARHLLPVPIPLLPEE